MARGRGGGATEWPRKGNASSKDTNRHHVPLSTLSDNRQFFKCFLVTICSKRKAAKSFRNDLEMTEASTKQHRDELETTNMCVKCTTK